MNRVLVLLVLVTVGAGAALAADPVVAPATLETEPFFAEDDADADDPAIWVHASDGARSIVVGTLKNGGLAVFDLDGETIQRIDYEDEDARQNNVDLLYGVELGGVTRDLAVVTDRGLDHLRVFAIDQAGADAATPLTEVTVADPPLVFEGDDEISAYGIAAWKTSAGDAFVAVSQRHRTAIALLRLVAGPAGTVGFERVDTVELPSTFSLGAGRSWSPCAEEDGELPQVEGMVADARRGFLFAAQEDVGIWRIPITGDRFGGAKLFDRVREFGRSYTRTFDPEEEEFVCEIDESSPSAGSDYLAADAEGLTIYRLDGARGYMLASSQGSSTFVVYDLTSLKPLQTFEIGGAATDHVDESDGAMVVGVGQNRAVAIREVLPGVFHWTTRHPRIGIRVSSYWLDRGGVAIDPLVPTELGLGWFAERPSRPAAVLLSNRHHYRESARFVEAFGCSVHCNVAGLHEFTHGEAVEGFRPGDGLPGGVVACEVGGLCPDETALHLPEERALVLADGLVRGGLDGPLGFVPDVLMDDPPSTKTALLAAYARLLGELDFEHLLLAHGNPLTGDGRAALERVVATGGRTAFEL